MTETKSTVYIRGLAANWIGYGANLAVMFFLTPFIIHSLGNVRYGVWCLLVSVTGYAGLLEMGVMTSAARHINVYIARNDQENLNRVVSTSLALYSVLGIILLAVVSIINPFLGKIFTRIPGDMVSQVRVILYLFCANIFLVFFAAISRQLLAANNRFDLQNVAILMVLPLSVIGTIVLLKTGHGLVSLAALQAVTSFLRCVILFLFAKWRGPNFQLGFGFIRKKTSLELLSFGIFAFIADVGTQLVFYTDSLVIGIFIGSAAIAFYNIGLMLVEHGRNLLKQFRNVITPDLLKSGGRSNLSETQWLMIKSIRFFMLLAIPLFVGFMTLGKEFISLWMGPEYDQSATILFILALAQFAAISSAPCVPTLMGLGRIRFLAAKSLLEGILNLALSILLVIVFDLGIFGVAIGSLIPMIIITGFAVPIYTCKVLEMKISEFVSLTFFRWVPAALLFGALCCVASNRWFSQSWPFFFAKVAVLGILYIPISITILLTPEERSVCFKQLKEYADMLRTQVKSSL